MKTLIRDRWDVIKDYVHAKEVMDLGCVDHESSHAFGEEWLHGKIAKETKSLLGVDYLPEEAQALRSRGFDVIAADIQTLNLDPRRFDTIVAGNVIEHLSNPGLFLDVVHRHLKDDGHFLLTTDNCYGLRSLKAITLADGVRPNNEHTMTFEEEVLRQLIERHRFRIVDLFYYNGPYPRPWKKALIDGLCQIRKSWAWQMLVVAQKR